VPGAGTVVLFQYLLITYAEIMQNTILAWPYNLMALIFGGVIIYSLLHFGTNKEIDISLLKDGKYFAFREKAGKEKYNTTIYVKSSKKVVEINGVVDGLGINQPGQLVEFKSTDKDCLGIKFNMIYMQSVAQIMVVEPLPAACRMYGNLKDADSLAKIDQ
jgi:hypothetical protein